MIRFILYRILGLVAVLVAMTFIIFLLQQIIPNDPARAREVFMKGASNCRTHPKSRSTTRPSGP